MKTVKIILTTIGVNAGPAYNIYDDADGFTTVRCGPILIAEFLPPDGYECTQIDDAATEVRLVEVGGVCETVLTLTITECTTTTTTTAEPTTTTTSTTEEPTPTTTTTTTIYPCYDCYNYDLYCDLGEGQSALFLCLTCAGEILYQSVPSEASPMTECCWSLPILISAPGSGHVGGGIESCGEYCPTTTTTTTVEIIPYTLNCLEYGVSFNNWLPGRPNNWEGWVYLASPATDDVAFTISFTATRNDEVQSCSSSVIVTVLGGNNSGIAEGYDCIENVNPESWTVDTWCITDVAPNDGRYIFPICCPTTTSTTTSPIL